MKQAKAMRKLKVFLWAVISSLLFATQLAAQGTQPGARRITGKVTAKVSDETISGATVSVKGTRNMVTTDNEGNFTIYAQTGETLVISSVGYTPKEIKVTAGFTQVDMRLGTDYSHLDDIVVVGYGKMKKTDLASAQITVTADDISKTVNTTFDQALQGRAANVYVSSSSGQPGAAPSVTIRGLSSLTGSTQPLYVIDGVQIKPDNPADDPYNHPTGFANILSSLNPDDIETMNVLQGPSATGIFGAEIGRAHV